MVRVSLTLTLKYRVGVNKMVTQCPTAVKGINDVVGAWARARR